MKSTEDASKVKKTASKLLRRWEKDDRSHDWVKEELVRLGLRKVRKKSVTKANHPLAVQGYSDNSSHDHSVAAVEKEESEESTGKANDDDGLFSVDSSDEEDYSSSEEEREVILVNVSYAYCFTFKNKQTNSSSFYSETQMYPKLLLPRQKVQG